MAWLNFRREKSFSTTDKLILIDKNFGKLFPWFSFQSSQELKCSAKKNRAELFRKFNIPRNMQPEHNFVPLFASAI